LARKESDKVSSEAPKTYEFHVPVDKPESTAETEALPGLPEPFRDMVKLFPDRDSATPGSLRKKKEDGGWIRLEIMVDPASQTTEYLIRQGVPAKEPGKSRESTFTFRADGSNSSTSCRVIISTRQGSMIEGDSEVRDEFNKEDLSEMRDIIETYEQIIKDESKAGEENG